MLGGEATLNKDQTIGAAILLICAIVGILYTATLFYPHWLNALGLQPTQANVQFWIVAVPVFVAFIAILGIGGWIGWTMATTPPPKPVEEITAESEKESEEPEKT